MRWLLDQGLPRSAAGLLREANEDAVHVGEIGMSCASDPDILALARTEHRIVVTLDADFHALLANSSATEPSVIRIREEGLKGPALAQRLLFICGRFGKVLTAGCVMSVTASDVRLRLLPIA